MVFLWDFASLLVLLSSACCEDTPLAKENVSPVINRKLDPMKKILTWSCRGNVTEQECTIDTPPKSSTRQVPQVREDNTYFCWFRNAVLHRGATLTVTGTSDGDAFQDVLHFQNPGREGSGAVNFSCLIYNVHFMKCSWRPGPAAPADVQYRLYGWTSRHDQEVECPRYIQDARGTRVGCHFDEAVRPQMTDAYSFWLNGTSNEAAIQFSDFRPFKAVQIEKYNPPANLTIRDNGSHHIVRWAPPKTRFEVSSQVLCYELDVQTEGSPSRMDPVVLRGSEENVYVIPSSSADAQRTVRARVKFLRGELWSEWTPTVRFRTGEQDGSSGSTLGLVGLVAGTAALVFTMLMFFCTKFPLRHLLFPPVPQANREVMGTFVPFPEMAWDRDNPPLSVQDPEDILAVEETQSFASRQAKSGDPAPPKHTSENVSPESCPLSVSD
ncbi:granulocyte-macrophage colony-stimulating factor receptor subunit alpha-like [Molossus molossus]|uniref:Colony stimulating factor 2 receptor subunit alpha n=1 Tax=Molossus molossus TaxID=27622 RepID=A0A7J8J721_MOLMO|nr:granulocyte-macrophage colony-stimulating factor receptor subunit alpha-like [Molossus molossus]KAF6491922.1 colony stimulating factor 2 receptor subunit alpha [Molossus molossus]